MKKKKEKITLVVTPIARDLYKVVNLIGQKPSCWKYELELDSQELQARRAQGYKVKIE